MIFDPADSHFLETVTASIEGWLEDYAARLTVQILKIPGGRRRG